MKNPAKPGNFQGTGMDIGYLTGVNHEKKFKGEES